MKCRTLCLLLLSFGLSAAPAAADTRFIVRDPAGLTALQQVCLTLGCNVSGGLDGGLGKLFLVTPPALVDPNTFLQTLRAQPGITNAELDALLKVMQAAGSVPPSSLSDSAPVVYYGVSVWHGYVGQPASTIIRLPDTQSAFSASGAGMVAVIIHLVAPTAQIMPLKAFGADGSGYLSDVLRAIYFAAQNGANVINMSFSLATYSQEMVSAIKFAARHQVICVASAGNDGKDEYVYPAALGNVMGVASTTNNDTLSSFSNYGDDVVWVAAPGEGIVTTYPFGTYAAGWGTSFSTPMVSGAAALLLGVNSNCNESCAEQSVAHAVPISADVGNGRLDLYQAVTARRQSLGLQ